MAQFDRKGGSTYTILMVLKDWNIQRAWVSTLPPDHDGEGTTGHQLCRTATCTRIEIKCWRSRSVTAFNLTLVSEYIA